MVVTSINFCKERAVHMLSGRFLTTTLVFTGLCLSFSLAGFAQSKVNQTGTGGIHMIKGKVYSPTGAPLDRPIEVELQSTTFPSLKLTTDVSSSFAFENLATGSYTVVVDAGDEFEIGRESVVIESDTIQSSVPLPSRTKIFNVPMFLRFKQKFTAGQKAEVINAKWADIPKDAVKHWERGNEEAADKQFLKAEAEFGKSIELAPSFGPAYMSLGRMLLSQGRVPDAISQLHLAIRYDPSDFESRLTMGIALLENKDFDSSRRELSQAAEINKTIASPRYYLGVVLVQKKDLDAAQKEFEAAREMNGEKTFPLLHRYLGGIYIAKQMNKEAVSELEAYIAQNPKARDGDRIKQTIADLKAKVN
jgi:tetratricopeptide (TPR) repeat protein